MTAWLTTAEAAAMLGYRSRATVIRALRRDGIGERMEGTKHGGKIAFWYKPDVVRLSQQRQEIEAKKAAGLKWCSGCSRWLPKEAFHRDFHLCKECRRAKNPQRRERDRKRRESRRKYEASFANTNPELVGGMDDWHAGEPPKPGDADKYACLYGWFQHRPIPPGQSKRKLYCRKCEAAKCYFHDLTPKQVCRRARVPTRYPEHRVGDYADA